MATLDLTREYPDPLADLLPPLTLDRQRVVQAAAFRRLQHKTQVFLAADGDHFRTRLTHTLEVAHLARVLAAGLGLNAELAEVTALAHDLGHPPFGHAGERALNLCLRDHGGFEHNAHTLRVVEYLEHPYPEFRGLNLTRAVQACLAGHETPYDRTNGSDEATKRRSDEGNGNSDRAGCPTPSGVGDGRAAPSALALPAEAAIADLADRLAYGLHDLQDALYAGLLEPADLAGVALWEQAGGGAVRGPQGPAALRSVCDRMQHRLVSDVAAGSAGARRDAAPPVLAPTLSLAVAAELLALEVVLRQRVYGHPRLRAADARAQEIVVELFAAYARRPEELPRRFAQRVAAQGLQRVIADYLAGMTDRFCLAEHGRMVEQRATERLSDEAT